MYALIYIFNVSTIRPQSTDVLDFEPEDEEGLKADNECKDVVEGEKENKGCENGENNNGAGESQNYEEVDENCEEENENCDNENGMNLEAPCVCQSSTIPEVPTLFTDPQIQLKLQF